MNITHTMYEIIIFERIDFEFLQIERLPIIAGIKRKHSWIQLILLE